MIDEPFAFGIDMAVMRCGRTRIQKTMVPMSIEAAKMPKCRNAVACKGTKARKAPTVVILPTIRGERTSLSVWRTDVV